MEARFSLVRFEFPRVISKKKRPNVRPVELQEQSKQFSYFKEQINTFEPPKKADP